MENKDLVLKTLADAGKNMRSGEIATITGIDKKEVDKALKKLVTEEKIWSPVRCFYAVKK